MKEQVEGEPAVIRTGFFQTQVCVPTDWNDEQVIEFTERENPCGTTKGWIIDKDNPESQERAQCMKFQSHVHIILNA